MAKLNKELKMKVKVDLSEAQEKAEELVKKLEEAKRLAVEISETECMKYLRYELERKVDL